MNDKIFNPGDELKEWKYSALTRTKGINYDKKTQKHLARIGKDGFNVEIPVDNIYLRSPRELTGRAYSVFEMLIRAAFHRHPEIVKKRDFIIPIKEGYTYHNPLPAPAKPLASYRPWREI